VKRTGIRPLDRLHLLVLLHAPGASHDTWRVGVSEEPESLSK
jgi:hypothetical protein